MELIKNTARWILFLPLAFMASWLVTRIYLSIWSLDTGRNVVISALFLHGVSGFILGAVGTLVAPNRRKIAVFGCIGLSCLVAVTYFARYSDFWGGASALVQIAACAWGAITVQEQEWLESPASSAPRNAMANHNVSGPLGSKTNPVRCEDPSGEKEYLSNLRDNQAQSPEFTRAGSVGTGPYGNLLDCYRVRTSDGTEREVYFDMYHRGHLELKPIEGFRIANFGRGRYRVAPPKDPSNLKQLQKFGAELSAACAVDAPTLREYLGNAFSVDQCHSILVFALSLIYTSYGDDRAKVSDALVRNRELALERQQAEIVYDYIMG